MQLSPGARALFASGLLTLFSLTACQSRSEEEQAGSKVTQISPGATEETTTRYESSASAPQCGIASARGQDYLRVGTGDFQILDTVAEGALSEGPFLPPQSFLTAAGVLQPPCELPGDVFFVKPVNLEEDRVARLEALRSVMLELLTGVQFVSSSNTALSARYLSHYLKGSAETISVSDDPEVMEDLTKVFKKKWDSLSSAQAELRSQDQTIEGRFLVTYEDMIETLGATRERSLQRPAIYNALGRFFVYFHSPPAASNQRSFSLKGRDLYIWPLRKLANNGRPRSFDVDPFPPLFTMLIDRSMAEHANDYLDADNPEQVSQRLWNDMKGNPGEAKAQDFMMEFATEIKIPNPGSG